MKMSCKWFAVLLLLLLLPMSASAMEAKDLTGGMRYHVPEPENGFCSRRRLYDGVAQRAAEKALSRIQSSGRKDRAVPVYLLCRYAGLVGD